MGIYNNYMVFDFETSGFNPILNAATEIAFSILNGLDLTRMDTYQSLFKPYSDILTYTDESLNVSSISMNLLEEDGEDIEKIGKEIIKIWEKANEHSKKQKVKYKLILVGYNAQFDIGFLQHISHVCEIDLSEYFDGKIDFYGNFQPTYLDTYYIAKLIWQQNTEIKGYKLIDCINRIGNELSNAHRAMNDVEGTEGLFKFCADRLRNDSTNITNNQKSNRRVRDILKI